MAKIHQLLYTSKKLEDQVANNDLDKDKRQNFQLL